MDEIIGRDCLEHISDVDLSPMAGKTVLVTGANGLIGAYIICFLHLSNLCANLNINIVAVSRHMPSGKFGDIFDVMYKFYPLDLMSEGTGDLPKADYIIHCGTCAPGGNLSDTVRLNVFATENFLQKAKRDGAKFLFVSSSEVYGDMIPENIPITEACPCLCSTQGAGAAFAESKRLGETACRTFPRHKTVEVKIARVFPVYGPGMTVFDKNIMGRFIGEALFRRKINVSGSWSGLHTFCYAADCIVMLLYVLIYGKSDVYNIGGREAVSARHLAEEISFLTGSPLSVKNEESKADSPAWLCRGGIKPDITKITSESGFKYFTSLCAGLQRTIVWNIRQFL